MARLKDVAELAGVSITTASSILNIEGGAARFTPACIQRVRSAAEKLGYKGNYHFRSLRTGRAEVLGLAFSGPAALQARLGWFRSEMVAGMMWACSDFGYELMIINDTDQGTAVRRGMDHIRQQRIDGLVVACPVTTEPIPDIYDSDLPVVVCRYEFETRLPCVGPDLDRSPELLMGHLIDLGHRRIAAIIPENCDASPVASPRFDYLKTWVKEHRSDRIDGLNLTLHGCGKWPVGWRLSAFVERARAFTHELLESRPDLTAIACWSEVTAQGVYKALDELGLRIPGDVSVVAFYDQFARHHHPPLTALSFREIEMCHRAAELLLNCLAEGGDFAQLKDTRLSVEPVLMVRQSTARPRMI